MFRGLIVGAIASFVVAGSANAAVLTWTLQDVVFTDGGSASGTFDFDTSTNTYSNISITTTGGTANAGSTYGVPDPANGGGNATVLIAVASAMVDYTDTPFLAFVWTSALTDLGGAVAIDPLAYYTFESLCSDVSCASVGGPSIPEYRRLVSGSAISTIISPPSEVPLPAALPLFLAGLAGLGVAKRRGRSARS